MKTEEPKFISLAAAAKMTNYSQDYISLLCRQGKLKAEKLGRNWVTTKEWLYEYVDKTEGKGASVVPVRIGESNEKIIDKKTVEKKKEYVGEKKAAVKPLFGSTVLELSIFCTISVILLANMVGFSRGIREVNKNFNVVQKSTIAQNSASIERAELNDAAKVTGAEKVINDPVNNIAAESACGGEIKLPKLMAFEEETNAAVIAEVTAEIEAGVTEPVTVEVYKDFAVVNYKSAPETDYLYMLSN
ncbi:MAG: hypothetical protein WC180_06010 [Candidatus Paceibacterota bacterium]